MKLRTRFAAAVVESVAPNKLAPEFLINISDENELLPFWSFVGLSVFSILGSIEHKNKNKKPYPPL